MKWFAPDYYREFACIAGACKHSCCVGWEIDIDSDTHARYCQVPGEWGKRLQENIAFDGQTASFRLTADERCPFLNAQGLCDLILAFGEKCLCQICTDHPRFRHFYEDRVEVGLGLCCEEAARVILSWEKPTGMMILEDDGEEDVSSEADQRFLDWRNQLFQLAQDRSLPVEKRVEKLAGMTIFSIGSIQLDEWRSFLLSLERMDEAWEHELASLANAASHDLSGWEKPFEQLLVYLLFRHLSLDDSLEANKDKLGFALFSWKLVRHLFAARPCRSLEALVELVRLFSSEIEYSDENVDAIIAKLHEDTNEKSYFV